MRKMRSMTLRSANAKVTFGVRDNSRKTEGGHGNTSKIPMGNLTSSDNSKKGLVSSLQMRQATADVS